MLSIYDALPPKDAFHKAKAAQRRALEIAEDLAEAHASLGFAAFITIGNLETPRPR